MPKKSSDNSNEIDLINDNRSSYNVVVLSSLWAKHLKRKEEFRHKPNAEVIKFAMQEVCLGKVTKEEIMAVAKAERPRKRFDDRAKDKNQTFKL